MKIFSKEGEFICEWPRATVKSQWSTDPNHLPANFKEMSEWNGTYFTRKAMTIGPNTGEVIKRILASRKLEVQTYRMCQGVLGFTKKYSKQALEETCRQALELGKPNYSFIKNSIQLIAEDLALPVTTPPSTTSATRVLLSWVLNLWILNASCPAARVWPRVKAREVASDAHRERAF